MKPNCPSQSNTVPAILSSESFPSEPEFLVDYDNHHKSWDEHRAYADEIQHIYHEALFFETYAWQHRYSERIAECSGVLKFAWATDSHTGESRLKLREAHFCRVRYCPICQWRRALMWRAKFYQILPALTKKYPKVRYIFLTLTVKNCDIEDLADTLTGMNEAWHRLVKRKAFRPVLGWIRTTEVTRSEDGTAHPHFHALLMVPPSWFGVYYVSQRRWTELWQKCLRVDYTPIVNIKTVKPKKGTGERNGRLTDTQLQNAIMETLKYSTKTKDMLEDEYWFLELTKQTYKRRFIATGGCLKNFFKLSEEDLTQDQDPEPADDDGSRIAFAWWRDIKRYRRWRKGDLKCD